MRRRRSPWAWDLALDTWLDLRFALMATMTIIRTLVPPMDFTGRAILSAACSSAQAPGITAIMDPDFTGVLTTAVDSTAVGITAVATAGDMVTAEATVGDAATEAGATATDSMVGEASMAVVGSTVVEDSTAVAGNQQFSIGTNRK